MRRGLAQLLPEGVLRLIRDPPNVRLYVGIMRIPSSQAQPNFYVGARLIYRAAFMPTNFGLLGTAGVFKSDSIKTR